MLQYLRDNIIVHRTFSSSENPHLGSFSHFKNLSLYCVLILFPSAQTDLETKSLKKGRRRRNWRRKKSRHMYMEKKDPHPHNHHRYNQQQQHLLKTKEDYHPMPIFSEEIPTSLAGVGGSSLFDLPLDQKGFVDLLGFQDHCDYFISTSPSPSLFDMLGHLQHPPPIGVPSALQVEQQQQPATADTSLVPAESSEVVNYPATPSSPSLSCSSNGHDRVADNDKAMEDDEDQDLKGQDGGGGGGQEEEDKNKK